MILAFSVDTFQWLVVIELLIIIVLLLPLYPRRVP
jgi:hypothetical protein